MQNVCFRSAWSVSAVAAAAMMLVAFGCGPKGPTTYPVEGTVVFPDGKTLSKGVIQFMPVAEVGKARSANGAIKDGKFRLTTTKEGDGAVAGRHRVLVREILPDYDFGESRQPPPKPTMDPRFSRFETSDLEFTVKEGPNSFTIQVEPPKAARR